MAGTRLRPLPAENTTWKNWESRHPNTSVLSFDTAYQRDYHHDPYATLPINRTPALFVEAGGEMEIFPFSQLHKARAPVRGELGGQYFVIHFDRHSKTALVQSETPDRIVWFVGFQNDLRHFFPKAEVYHYRKPRR